MILNSLATPLLSISIVFPKEIFKEIIKKKPSMLEIGYSYLY